MPLTSDLTVDPSKFDRKLADEQTKQFNQKLINIWKEGPRWYEVRQFQSSLVAIQYGDLMCSRLVLRNTESYDGKARLRSPSQSCFLKA
jgi:hypothetical protein